MSKLPASLALAVVGIAAVLGSGGTLLWSTYSAASALTSTSLDTGRYLVAGRRAISIRIAASGESVWPRAAALAPGGTVTFVNRLGRPVTIQTAERSEAAFSVQLRAHATAHVRLTRPGLYHYYDALSARAGRVVANNQVITGLHSAGAPREGWIAVIPTALPQRGVLLVPVGQDLFSPKVVVSVVGGTVTVVNRDADTHNFVVDPASPAGGAFSVDGTEIEPATGWQRALVLEQAGLYHVYCTLHTRVVGVRDGWQVVVPRSVASGFREHDPMEAWIVVLPAAAA